jgi:transcriptional regulator GlxA family with amidase domain
VFVYDGTEAIDLATFGVLSMAGCIRPEIDFHTIAPKPGIITLENGLRVVPDFGIRVAPCLDVHIVTGGPGWSEQTKNSEILEFIRGLADTPIFVSVCTGGLFLATSGVLDGKCATTKYEIVTPEMSPLELMGDGYRQIDGRHASPVAYDKIITGGGVLLCIDTMLYVLEKLFDHAIAAEAARIPEYKRASAANLRQCPPITISQ